jgi:hypothetical protein
METKDPLEEILEKFKDFPSKFFPDDLPFTQEEYFGHIEWDKMKYFQ